MYWLKLIFFGQKMSMCHTEVSISIHYDLEKPAVDPIIYKVLSHYWFDDEIYNETVLIVLNRHRFDF